MIHNITFNSPVNDQLDWDCQELKAKFPKSKSDITGSLPQVQSCMVLLDGQVRTTPDKPDNVQTPIVAQDTPDQNIVFTQYDMTTEETARKALAAAQYAYMFGRGTRARMSIYQRCIHMEHFADDLEKKTDEIAALLRWEIAKNVKDSKDEVVRTVSYIRNTIREAKALFDAESSWQEAKGMLAQIRHLPIGVVLASSPFNYPLNEAYTTFIPALMMGNSVIVRAPQNGATPHFPTLELFAKHFPKGTIQVLTGSGREIMGALIRTGHIDALAFIGRAVSAKGLLSQAENPQSLHLMYEGEAKDTAILLPDADLKVAIDSCASGMSSFNGQRCTAIKMIWVPRSLAEQFIKGLAEKIDSLPMGMPWGEKTKITPLCEDTKPAYMKELITDALSKGVHIVNSMGGKCWKTLCALTVLAPANHHMKIWNEEQFAPVTPVAVYDNIQEPLDYVSMNSYGLQCAVFGYEERLLRRVVDALSYIVGRLNINGPDQRGPDVFPFTGRGNSALGILNATEALKHFSIPTMVATKVDDERNATALRSLNTSEHCQVITGAK